ncbi:hypothetical protein CTAYLR_007175 [Chrysophaeum taylorii]|uniref:Bifunctional lysine-specific demethylase and histidyl-hydroxylase n=1 Tax=Chrysophaeum taylorii TaxID=2483200 RepID=A0AAD7UKP9_9STRA|nr:hypothetical protein CTAYLR_007175 [Chrysophaeum taylorii]
MEDDKKKRKKKKKRLLSPVVVVEPAKKRKREEKVAPPPPSEAKDTEEEEEEEEATKTVVEGSGVSRLSVGDAVYRSGTLDSDVRARKVFAALLEPVSVADFYATYFEQRALVLRGRSPKHVDGWISERDVWVALEAHELEHGVDVDVTRFEDGKRSNVGTGRCEASVARLEFETGASLRLRTPQERVRSVHALCEALEDEFGATVSANAYLTPPHAQGFAPHFDDVDAFVLQVEGDKRWKVFAPTTKDRALPRVSSEDFGAIAEGYDLVFDGVLSRGDMLYMPRGFAHEARCSESRSLHLTVSTHRENCWADFIERVLGTALNRAAAEDPALRASLPRDCFHLFGVQHRDDDDGETADDGDGDETADDDDLVAAVVIDPELPRGQMERAKRRARFRATLAKLLDGVLARVDPDDAADDMAARFVAERQPPSRSRKKVPISATTLLHPAGRRLARLVVDGDKALVYHACENSTAHRKQPVACLEFDLDDGPAIERLLDAHPARPVVVHSLPLPDLDDRHGFWPTASGHV